MLTQLFLYLLLRLGKCGLITFHKHVFEANEVSVKRFQGLKTKVLKLDHHQIIDLSFLLCAFFTTKGKRWQLSIREIETIDLMILFALGMP